MSKLLTPAFYIALLLLLAAACKQDSGAEEGEEERSGPIRVKGALVESTAFSSTLTSTANLLPFEQVDLKAPVAGKVMAIYFKEGQEVQKGDRLLRIDDRQWRAQLQGLQAQLSTAESTLQRNEELMEREGISREALEQSQAETTNLQAQIQELRVRIDLANVQAPFSGAVGMRNFSLGDYLSQGQTLTRLVQKDSLRVDFSLPSEYADKLAVGQKIKVVPNASGDTARATIYAINPAINRQSREIQLRARLNNKESEFIPGDFAEVVIEVTESENALLIPAESVIPEADSHIVYRVKNGKAVKQEVRLGRRTETEIQILEGLSDGDTVLLTGLMQVEDGSEVEVKELTDSAL